MRLHENKQLFRQAIQFTAQHMNLPEIYVEKDYWVTYALRAIFSDKIGKETVFKGGTSLLKCFRFIERFSEDIDLVVFRNAGESNNQLSNKIKAIGNVVSKSLPEILVEGVTQKMGMNRKTAHSYAKEFDGAYGQVRDVIIIEATWLGYFEPYETRPVSSFIHDMMIATQQEILIGEYELQPFDVLVLQPRRTICEKIMSLVRFSYDEDAITALRNKIRHLYDLYKLLQDETLNEFFHSAEFEQMVNKVGEDDIISYKNNNEWLKHHPKNALIFADAKNVWSNLAPTYEGAFKNLIFDASPPASDELFTFLSSVYERLKLLSWKLSNSGRT